MSWECLVLIPEEGLSMAVPADGFGGQAVSPAEDSQGHTARYHPGQDFHTPAQTYSSLKGKK